MSDPSGASRVPRAAVRGYASLNLEVTFKREKLGRDREFTSPRQIESFELALLAD
jgi:hypothetical protein